MKEEILEIFEIIHTTENFEEVLVLWAEEKLSENIESESLILLAGLIKSEYNKARKLFEKSVLELGFTIPSRKEILFSYSAKIANDIITNNLDPNEGCNMLSLVSIDLDYPDELSMFNLLAHEQSGHENIGIYAKNLIPEIKKSAEELIDKLKAV